MNTLCIAQFLGSSVLQLAADHTPMSVALGLSTLLVLSLLSWIVFRRKSSSLKQARQATEAFYEAYGSTREPMELYDRNERFAGAPMFEVYCQGVAELQHHLHHNPVRFRRQRLISSSAFNALRMTVEEAMETEVHALGRGTGLLRWTAVAAPVIGILGALWGTMTALAPGAVSSAAVLARLSWAVDGAMVSTVAGVLVGLQAMVALTLTSGSIQSLAVEIRRFGRRFVARIEHSYLDQRPIEEEIEQANEVLASKIVALVQKGKGALREIPVLASHD